MLKAKKEDKAVHLLGIPTDGGIHSHIEHFNALLKLASSLGLKRVYIHYFTDGRDTPPVSGEGYIVKLEEKMKEKGIGKIASISGRFYAMDRDKRWERVQKAYNALVKGKIKDGIYLQRQRKFCYADRKY